MTWRILLMLLSGALLAEAALVNRWTFNEPAGSIQVIDVAGGRHGQLRGDARLDGEGRMHLAGIDGHADLPNGLLSSLTNATFEVWFTLSPANQLAWARIFDFGSNASGEDQQGLLLDFICLTPASSPNHDGFTWLAAGVFILQDHLTLYPWHLFSVPYASPLFVARADEPTLDFALSPGVETHLAVAWDWTNRQSRLYVNGRLVKIGNARFPLFLIRNINNWLGRANDNSPYLAGAYNDFRLYNHAFTDLEAATSFDRGPNPGQALADAGTIQSVRLHAPSRWHSSHRRQVSLTGDFQQAAGIELRSEPGASFESSNPAVIRSEGGGFFTPLQPGTAVLKGGYQGREATASVTVHPLGASLRLSFNEPAGSFQVQDRMGGEPSMLQGGASLTGTGELVLDGISGFLNLPNHLVSRRESVTVETWVTWNGSPGIAWYRIMDFGSNTGGEDQTGTGTSDFLLMPSTYGDNRLGLAVRGAGNVALTAIASPRGMQPGQGLHLAAVFDGITRTSRLYTNGLLAASGTLSGGLAALRDYNCWLGKSQWAGDVWFQGAYDEFRVYPGVLNDAQVLQSFQAGPNATGVFEAVEVSLPAARTSTGSSLQASAVAWYSLLQSNVTEVAAWSSSQPQVASVSGSGAITAHRAGSTVISATFGGSTATATLQVVDPRPALLRHRYSFSGPPESLEIRDSVGQANGLLVNPGPAEGQDGDGRLVLSGISGYVDLPNGLISRFSSLSLEMWIGWTGISTSERVFDFGSTSGGENQPGARLSSLSLTPFDSAGNLVLESVHGTDPAKTTRLSVPGLFPGSEVHLALVYNPDLAETRLYLNGEWVEQGTALLPLSAIQDVNNWLGRSNSGDPLLGGTYAEFRIYEGELTHTEIRESFESGPDQLPGKVDLRILQLTRGAGKWVFRVESIPVKETYAIEQSSVLGGAWSPAGPVTRLDQSASVVTLEIDDPGGQARFFRVRHP